MRKILHIIFKELIQLRRDRMMFPLLFVAPALQLIILGYVANIDVKNIKMGVLDLDNSTMSREVIRSFTSSGYFLEKTVLKNINQIDDLMGKGELSLAIFIGKGFEKKILTGEKMEIQFIIDGTDATTATIAMNYSAQILGKFYAEKLETFLFFGPSEIELRSRVFFNPELKGSHFMVPAVIALLLTLIIGVLSSMAIVREKEAGTFEQLIVTPIKPFHFITGKVAPFVLIGYLDITIIILVAIYWFRIPVKGNLLFLYLFSGFYIFYTAGIGIFLSTVSKSQQQAMVTAMFFFFLPSILLSGFVFPIENMPRIIQYLTYFVPLRFFLEIVRGVFLKGSNFLVLLDEAGIILLWGVVVFTLSFLRFKKTI
ncbi:MAG: ABC transporter permease [Candidatus Aminicenantia bacterium]